MGFPPATKIVVPVRYAAWLAGDLGRTLERTLQSAIESYTPARVSRLPKGFLVESPEAPGPLLEAVHHAALALEAGVEEAYPVFHHEMGPVWTGTLQAVFA
jgi:hypothetical protein